MAWTTTTDVSAGSVLTASKFNDQVLGNINALTAGRRLAVVTRTTDYTANQTTIASATDFFSSDLTWTATAATEYIVEFYCCRVIPGDYVTANIVTGAGAGLACVSVIATGAMVFARWNYTPGAGTASINVRCLRGTTNGTFYASNGGTGPFDYAPATLTVYGPVTTT